jgi:hypothetical protein
MEESADPTPPLATAVSTGGSARRWIVSLAAVAILVAAAAVAVGLTHRDPEPAPVPVQRADVVLDLLGWIPATDETRRAFAVWSEDPGEGPGTPIAITAVDPLFDRLALTPLPFTLGRSADWPNRFGYTARDVTRWATAGTASSIVVLGGDFDVPMIERKLKDAGYRTSTYHGVMLYVLHDVATPSGTLDGDAVAAANAVALFADRVITSASPATVRDAIDAAQGRIPSLADEPAVAAIGRTLAPISGLVAVDAADHAIDCGAGGSWTHGNLGQPSGRYVVVGYGRLGIGGERRTLVATNFTDRAAADAALASFTDGWESGTASSGETGADIAVYGRVSAVSETDRLLVAELVDGREEGWVRAGIRFAIPVCEAAVRALPPGAPNQAPAEETQANART